MNYNEMCGDDGYMLDPTKWTTGYAEWKAGDLGITLSEDHWKLINLFREYYDEFQITPSSRVAQKLAKKEYSIDSKGFYTLFPNGPKQCSMISGLYKPSGC